MNHVTARTQQTTPGRWALPFLAALLAVLATILSSATASAASNPTAETRVGASAVVVDVFVEPPQDVRAGQRLGKDVAGPGIVVATGVAAKSEGPLSRMLGNRVRDERGSFALGGGASRLTNTQITDMASRLGFRPTNFKSQRQIVFTDGKSFITQDITSHTGGLWKMARTPEALTSRSTRMGTYDYDLNYIAP